MNTTQEHYWRDRYALRDWTGETIEKSIEDTWSRVADAISTTPEERSDFYRILSGFRFVPGGRILAGAGAESDKTFYNCYVIPVETRARRANRAPVDTIQAVTNDGFQELRFPPLADDKGADSREAIFDTIGTMVGIMSRGGGVGINWSVLRPRNSYLTRVSGHSSGPVGWMDVASTAVGEVIQGGSRRGAAMFMLDIWHPDVLQFINAKRDNNRITNANISVGVTDAFMEALSRDDDWTFVFPDTEEPAYNDVWDGDIEAWKQRGLLVDKYDTVPARQIWDAISEAAWESGEPGVIFLDRYNSLSTANGEERIICVNPCGEQGLGAYSVCNLGSMNLYAYVLPISMGKRYFDFDTFSKDVKHAITFLDNVIDKTTNYPDETAERQKRLRRVGLGVMGLADALVALGIRYGSRGAVDFTESVFRTMKDSAIKRSQELAATKGPALGWNPSLAERPYLAEYTQRTGNKVKALRNLFLLTQAPTGTISLLADVSSGIEPYFSIKVWREDRTGGRLLSARAVTDIWGIPQEGTLSEWASLDYIVTAKDVTVDEHIAMQAAVQRYVDSSVSKTINAPASQTKRETSRAFTRAYYANLKGIAYYRDGSRNKQVLYSDNPNERIRELEQEVNVLKERLAASGAYLTGALEGDTIPEDVSGDHSMGSCPACGLDTVIRQEGCLLCGSCGWSAC